MDFLFLRFHYVCSVSVHGDSCESVAYGAFDEVSVQVKNGDFPYVIFDQDCVILCVCFEICRTCEFVNSGCRGAGRT